jgi:hypothetical protein
VMAMPYLSMFGLRQDIVNLIGLFFISCPFSSKLSSESFSYYILNPFHLIYCLLIVISHSLLPNFWSQEIIDLTGLSFLQVLFYLGPWPSLDPVNN